MSSDHLTQPSFPDPGGRVVIVGAGMAGVQSAACLRERGWRGPITLLGAEPHPPYDRPPLSKAILLGGAEGSAFDVDFAGLDVRLDLGRTALALDDRARTVETDAGAVPYDHLVLATGAEPTPPPGGRRAEGVHVLRTLDDARRLRSVLARREEVLVVGAGWIGAEFATAAREAGCAVTVVEAADRPLPGALPAEVTAPMARWYEDAGVRLRTGTRVASVSAGSVTLTDGTVLSADAVVVGTGARPATGWLDGSGVERCPDASVKADALLRTTAPEVYAVGDCASFPSARYGRRLLVHHWDNALQAPRTVAEALTDGDSADPYDPVPYFWSEQFGRFVQYAGHHPAADALLLRGDPADAAWTALWLRDGTLVALLAVGRPRDLAQGRRLLARGARLDRGRAQDPAVPLKATVLAG